MGYVTKSVYVPVSSILYGAGLFHKYLDLNSEAEIYLYTHTQSSICSKFHQLGHLKLVQTVKLIDFSSFTFDNTKH